MRRLTRCNMVLLIIGPLLLCMILSTKLCATGFEVYGLSTKERYMHPEMTRRLIIGLRATGCDVNDIEAIKHLATDNSKLSIRSDALHVATYKFGPKAIPILKRGLDDSDPRVRIKAARMLAIVGDQSGLERMRKDIVEFTKNDPPERGSEAYENTFPMGLRTKGGRLGFALSAATVLAEFGDSSVYELAVKQAFEGKTAKKRIDSIIILTELGRTIDDATLKAKGINPEDVLIRIAESEKHPFILGIVEASVSNNMRPESQIRILEKLKQSPFLSDLKLRVTEKAIKRAHLRQEQEKGEKDKEKTQEQNQKTEEDKN